MRQTLLVCDRCGSKRSVMALEGSRSDSQDLSLDLCTKCWGEFVEAYNPRLRARKRRREFEVVDDSQVPPE